MLSTWLPENVKSWMTWIHGWPCIFVGSCFLRDDSRHSQERLEIVHFRIYLGSLFNCAYYSFQDHQPSGGLAHSELGPPIWVINEENSLQASLAGVNLVRANLVGANHLVGGQYGRDQSSGGGQSSGSILSPEVPSSNMTPALPRWHKTSQYKYLE